MSDQTNDLPQLDAYEQKIIDTSLLYRETLRYHIDSAFSEAQRAAWVLDFTPEELDELFVNILGEILEHADQAYNRAQREAGL